MSQFAFDAARRAQQKAIRQRRNTSSRQPRPRSAHLSPQQQAGRQAEQQAARYLHNLGVQILAHNLLTRMGEIDLLGWHQQILLFIEVRSRHSTHFGGAIASVTPQKQQRLIRSAQLLLPTVQQQLNLRHAPACRFDVVTIQGKTIAWIPHAFVSE